MEEGNGSPDDEEFKLAKNVSCLNDEGEENGEKFTLHIVIDNIIY